MTKHIRLFVSIILITTFVLNGFIYAFAALVAIDDKEYKNISVIKNANLYFVSIYDIMKTLGYTVEWNGKNKEITVKNKTDYFLFKLNSKYVTAKNKKITLSKQIILINQRSYIYSLDISKIVSYNVKIDEKKQKVLLTKLNSITSRGSTSKNVPQIVQNNKNNLFNKLESITYGISSEYVDINIITTTKAVYKAYTLSNPDRIVVDLSNVDDKLTNNVININYKGVFRVRHSFNTNGNEKWTRVVVDTNKNILSNYQILSGNNKLVIRIKQPVEIPIVSNIDDVQTVVYQAYIERFDIKNINEQTSLVVYCSDEIKPSINKISESNVFVLKFPHTIYENFEQNTYYFNEGLINFIGINQNEQEKYVEFLISSKTNNYIIQSDKNITMLTFSNANTFINADNNYITIQDNQISQVIVNAISQKSLIIKSQNPIIVSDSIYKLEGISDYSYLNDKKSEIVINFLYDIKSVLNLSNEKLYVKVEKINTNSKKWTIYIDPGHGGKDPGATYKLDIGGKIASYFEKDINLAISKKLFDKLKALGYNVKMTRYDDTYIDLYERTRMANNDNAQLFISIHNNAHTSTSIRGTMVLYKSSNTDSNIIDNKKFAQIVLNEIVNTANTQNKGIVERPDLAVLRTANMSAILVEVLYGTNTNDLILLLNDQFKDQVVSAIANAVEKIFNNDY